VNTCVGVHFLVVELDNEQISIGFDDKRKEKKNKRINMKPSQWVIDLFID